MSKKAARSSAASRNPAWLLALENGEFDDLSAKPGGLFADAMASVPDSLTYFSRDETAPLGMCMLALSTWVASGTFTGYTFLIGGPPALEQAQPGNVRRFLQEVRMLWAYLDAKERLDPKWLFQIAKSRDCREFELQGKFYPSASAAIFDLGKEAYSKAHEIVLTTLQPAPPYDSFEARRWASALPALNVHFTKIVGTHGQEIETARSKLWAALQQEIAAIYPGLTPEQLPKKARQPTEPRPLVNPNQAQALTPTPAPALDDEDERILRALAKQPHRLLTQDAIEAESGVSRKTISSRIKHLLAAGLVGQPRGPKSGTQITPAGLELCNPIEGSKSTR